MNLYHDGNEGIGWHSDDEKSIGDNSPIVSVSIGAERKFSFKHKQSKKIILILLEHVSLLLTVQSGRVSYSTRFCLTHRKN